MADRRLPLLATLLLAGSLSCPADAKRLPPRDECSADPRLRAFIGTLRATVASKDAPALLRMLSPEIKTDFGGGAGFADFRTRWQLDQGAASPVWRELDRALALGCAREKSYAAIPYLFLRMSEALRNGGDDDIDPFDTFLATGTGIAVRAAPDTKARKIDTLDWDIVTTTSGAQPADDAWRRITTPRGRVGYVSANYLRTSADYRILIMPVGGRLLITSFVAGD